MNQRQDLDDSSRFEASAESSVVALREPAANVALGAERPHSSVEED
jgi:hypothetical protein